MADHTDLTTRDMASKALTLVEQHMLECANQARENRVMLRWILGLLVTLVLFAINYARR